MIEIKITQNDYGRFHIFGESDSMSFSMWILKDGKRIKKQDGDVITNCKLYYAGENDRREEFNYLFENGKFDELFEICFDEETGYLTNGTTKEYHQRNCEYFNEVYKENKEELERNWKEKYLNEFNKKIEQITQIKFPELLKVADIKGE